MKDDQSDFVPAVFDFDPEALSFFQDTFLELFNGPFGDPCKSLGSPYTGGIPYQTVIPTQDPWLVFSEQTPAYEPERPFATEAVQAILGRVWSIPLDPTAQEEIATHLNFLLTTARIRKFISMYFKYWQPNCPILHRPTFDPDTVSLSLLVAVAFMGAMYSDNEKEVHVAKRLVDFAELLVFSSDIFSFESEIGAVFCGNRNTNGESNDWLQLQNFQAGYIILIVQYWAGSLMSRNRAMENRFSEVVKVFLHLSSGM
ncbi:hypothetical protein EYZ11_003409 [Aspergillus tanneri]|uniref:Xylanolytic transcriptional activator regulatory domain-containing protein n=1 Tax=Aspergillus tanneri TaxID=1220188 RepID=A0A4S3JTJ1_9EURO|nr:hypothetical protein EYZ11_003409 [Aspergillus tanneri]